MAAQKHSCNIGHYQGDSRFSELRNSEDIIKMASFQVYYSLYSAEEGLV